GGPPGGEGDAVRARPAGDVGDVVWRRPGANRDLRARYGLGVSSGAGSRRGRARLEMHLPGAPRHGLAPALCLVAGGRVTGQTGYRIGPASEPTPPVRRG